MNKEQEEEILLRLDERTAHTQNEIKRLHNRLDRHEGKIEENKARSKRNREKIKLGTWTGGTIVAAVVAKLAGLLPN